MLLALLSPDQWPAHMASDRPCLVLFSMRGCPACQAFKSPMRRFAMAHADISCVNVDVDRFEAISDEAKIKSMPTIILYRKGEQVSRKPAGGMNLEQLEKWVEKHDGQG